MIALPRSVPGVLPGLFLFLQACAATAADAPCDGPQGAASALQAGAVKAVWRTQPQPPVVGEPFVLLLRLCPTRTQLLRVDASMPAHRHGMNYQPSVQLTGPGQWQVEGMLWHMAGQWELRLDTELDGKPQRLTQSVTLQ